MRRKFVVLTNSSTKEQNTAFLGFLRENGVGWWHHFQDSWLIDDAQNKIDALILRDKLAETHPNIHVLVIEVNNVTWAGRGISGEGGTFGWLRSSWEIK